MDISEAYIKMCEKAVEIQTMRESDDAVASGDFFFDDSDVVCVFDAGYVYGLRNLMTSYQQGWECEDHVETLSSDRTWLPRQDQLQGMVGDSPYNNVQNAMWSILDDFHKYAFTPNIFKEFIPTSMEQLWLTFVMKEKYGKVWDGEDWEGRGNQT